MSTTFWQEAGRILNAGQARTILLTGNIQDLFPLPDASGDVSYAPLVHALIARWDLPNFVLVVYELNGPIRFMRDADRDKVRDAWLRWRTGRDADEQAIRRMLAAGRETSEPEATAAAFDLHLQRSIGHPATALEVLRQMCLCSRTLVDGRPLLREDLIVIIEAADLILPDAPVAQMGDADRQRLAICQDWFADPGFADGGDSVLLVAESRSLIHQRIAQMPHLAEVEVPSPDRAARQAFIEWFRDRQPAAERPSRLAGVADLADSTAGLSIHALRQLLLGARHRGTALQREEVIRRVELFIQSQMGEDVVELKKPTHTLDDVVGFRRLKHFLRDQLIPRFRMPGPDALPGAAVCGPIGGGKTFIFEAVAAELDLVVLVLKNIRSPWYGQTDVIFERLRRVLIALDKAVIFVDEADTQFGGIGAESHATERRLTGKIQAMMSDTTLRGKVMWLLMTARIHRLSPDIRRPGRVGDLIIPVLDPVGEDRKDFLHWMVAPVLTQELRQEEMDALDQATQECYAATFASLRSELKARARIAPLSLADVLTVIQDYLSPDIGPTRQYQTLQALLNCTRRSLLPDPNITDDDRLKWAETLRTLEARGMH